MSSSLHDEKPFATDDKKAKNRLKLWTKNDHMNLERPLWNAIMDSQYFKDLYELKTYHEVIDEIYSAVKHVGPYDRGHFASRAYILLYKFFTMKLTKKQLVGLITHKDSPYVRAIGFLYLRYCIDPEDAWEYFKEYLDDDEELELGLDGSRHGTIGEMVRELVREVRWFEAVLPRIPTAVHRKLLAEMDELDGIDRSKLTEKHTKAHRSSLSREEKIAIREREFEKYNLGLENRGNSSVSDRLLALRELRSKSIQMEETIGRSKSDSSGSKSLHSDSRHYSEEDSRDFSSRRDSRRSVVDSYYSSSHPYSMKEPNRSRETSPRHSFRRSSQERSRERSHEREKRDRSYHHHHHHHRSRDQESRSSERLEDKDRKRSRSPSSPLRKSRKIEDNFNHSSDKNQEQENSSLPMRNGVEDGEIGSSQSPSSPSRNEEFPSVDSSSHDASSAPADSVLHTFERVQSLFGQTSKVAALSRY